MIKAITQYSKQKNLKNILTFKSNPNLQTLEKDNRSNNKNYPNYVHLNKKLISNSSHSILKNIVSTQKELDKMIFTKSNHKFLFLEISEVKKGVKIQLEAQTIPKQIIQLELNLSKIDIEKNKVKHTFPMPLLFKSTKFLKIILETFKMDKLKIIVKPSNPKFKIKYDNILLELSSLNQKNQFQAQQKQFGFIVMVDPCSLIEQAQNFRKRKFNTDRTLPLMTCKSATFLQNVIKSPNQKQIINVSIIQNQNENIAIMVNEDAYKQKPTNLLESTIKQEIISHKKNYNCSSNFTTCRPNVSIVAKQPNLSTNLNNPEMVSDIKFNNPTGEQLKRLTISKQSNNRNQKIISYQKPFGQQKMKQKSLLRKATIAQVSNYKNKLISPKATHFLN